MRTRKPGGTWYDSSAYIHDSRLGNVLGRSQLLDHLGLGLTGAIEEELDAAFLIWQSLFLWRTAACLSEATRAPVSVFVRKEALL